MAARRSSGPLQFDLLLSALLLLLLPLQTALVNRFGLLLVLSALILFSWVRDFDRLPAFRAIAGVGVVTFGLELLRNPIQSLAIRLEVRLSLPEAAASLLLIFLVLLAAVLYFFSVEVWSLRLMHHAAQRLEPS